ATGGGKQPAEPRHFPAVASASEFHVLVHDRIRQDTALSLGGQLPAHAVAFQSQRFEARNVLCRGSTDATADEPCEKANDRKSQFFPRPAARSAALPSCFRNCSISRFCIVCKRG